MNGLMMDYPLTLRTLFERGGRFFPDREIVSRLPDRSIHRTNYGEFTERVQKLANALLRMGMRPGDRVATLAWNHSRHLEAYFAVPLAGGVLHTLNPRLSPSDLGFIASDAEDTILLVDDVLLAAWAKFRGACSVRHTVVWSNGAAVPDGMHDYEALLAAEPSSFDGPRLEENQAAALCYTSGTTGKPKGVLYSHRALVLHTLVTAMPDCTNLSQREVVMAVVPMFHANAWGVPYGCTMLGAKQVLPGPHLDAESLLDLVERERVTWTAGVPTIWLGILQALDREPKRWDVSCLREMMVGGSAVPQAMIEGFQERHGIRIVHGWGMTELSPVGSICRLTREAEERPKEERYRVLARQGLPLPFVEMRVVSDQGIAPRDGQTMGELQVRGPWVVGAYFNGPAQDDKFTEDGWFRTGDVATIEPDGYLRITDRSKDLIKSGGEWISSVDLENALMGHPAVKEAAVVAMKHPKWDERPVACVVLKDGTRATEDELREHLRPLFASWWIPDAFIYMSEIPRTTTGKFLKSALREQVAKLIEVGEQRPRAGIDGGSPSVVADATTQP